MNVDIRDDIKIIVAFKDNNGEIRPPQETPFEFTLFSTNSSGLKMQAYQWKAKFDGTTFTNCQVVIYDGDKNPDWIGKEVLLVTYDYDKKKYGDAGFFKPGKLKHTLYVFYPDTQMPDASYSKMYSVSSNIEIVNKDLE